jgi:hypothetical protein
LDLWHARYEPTTTSSKIIAAIEDPPVIVKILSHLGLPSRAPPLHPVSLFAIRYLPYAI